MSILLITKHKLSIFHGFTYPSAVVCFCVCVYACQVCCYDVLHKCLFWICLGCQRTCVGTHKCYTYICIYFYIQNWLSILIFCLKLSNMFDYLDRYFNYWLVFTVVSENKLLHNNGMNVEKINNIYGKFKYSPASIDVPHTRRNFELSSKQ